MLSEHSFFLIHFPQKTLLSIGINASLDDILPPAHNALHILLKYTSCMDERPFQGSLCFIMPWKLINILYIIPLRNRKIEPDMGMMGTQPTAFFWELFSSLYFSQCLWSIDVLEM